MPRTRRRDLPNQDPEGGDDRVSMTRVQQILMAATAGTGHTAATLPHVLCSGCAAAIPVTGVGLILMNDQGPAGLVAATDGPAATMEELQFTLGEGPCVDASTAGRPVLQPHLRQTGPTRWPGFGPGALDVGIEAIFAFPLQVGGIRLGVLDLYRDVPGTLSANELGDALAFADAATRVLLHLQDQMPLHGGLHPDLSAPSHHRPEVHQATGMVSVQAVVGLAEALLLLRAHAYSSERSILEVARDVVARRLRFPAEREHHE